MGGGPRGADISPLSGNVAKEGSPLVLKQKGATAWVDGKNLLGPVVGNFCTRLAMELAREHGVGWVVCRGSNHYGICGYYASQMAAAGLLVRLTAFARVARAAAGF